MADSQPVKVPATFKSLLPFVRRAEELDRDSSRPESKLIAYFCRQYAMELGIKLRENDASNEATDYLLSLMDRLEEEKSKLPDFTQEEGKEICEDFAMEIFNKADDEDRAGCATKGTARTFYAAGTFFDILNQFGDISEDIVEKRRYCKFKAATILKAIKEGKTPTPGPPETALQPDGSSIESAPAAPTTPLSSSLPPAPTPAVSPPPSSPSPQYQQPAAPTNNAGSPHSPTSFPSFTSSVGSVGSGLSASANSHESNWRAPSPSPSPSPTPASSSHPMPSAPSAPTPMYHQPPQAPQPNYNAQSLPARSAGSAVSQNNIDDAIECAKFAIAALKVKDMKLAEERLEMALRSIR